MQVNLQFAILFDISKCVLNLYRFSLLWSEEIISHSYRIIPVNVCPSIFKANLCPRLKSETLILRVILIATYKVGYCSFSGQSKLFIRSFCRAEKNRAKLICIKTVNNIFGCFFIIPTFGIKLANSDEAFPPRFLGLNNFLLGDCLFCCKGNSRYDDKTQNQSYHLQIRRCSNLHRISPLFVNNLKDEIFHL